ncbi:MAG: hypothetical protein JXB32_20640 [Deltaproteobacteria bacterium]|nr:hypothetical protein [Deltaproteobacteria bacterium]
MAQRGDKRRAAGLAVVGLLLAVGGIATSLAARHGYQVTVEERAQAEASARTAGESAPPGTSAEQLRKEADVIPYVLHLFTFGGVILLLMSLAEIRGWRLFDPIAEQPPPPKLS